MSYDRFVRLGVSFRYRKSDEEKGENYFDMITTGGCVYYPISIGCRETRTNSGGLSTMARAGFQRVLLRHLPPTCQTHFHKKLVSFDDSMDGPIVLHFEDGSTAECDILIGADGIKSAVRHSFLTTLEKAGTISHDEAMTSKQPVWTGTIAYRGIVPKKALESVSPDHRAVTDRLLVRSPLIRNIYLFAYNSHSMLERTRQVHICIEEGSTLNWKITASHSFPNGTRHFDQRCGICFGTWSRGHTIR